MRDWSGSLWWLGNLDSDRTKGIKLIVKQQITNGRDVFGGMASSCLEINPPFTTKNIKSDFLLNGVVWPGLGKNINTKVS